MWLIKSKYSVGGGVLSFRKSRKLKGKTLTFCIFGFGFSIFLSKQC